MTHWRSRLLLAISWLTFTFYSYLHEVGSISLSTADARSVRRSTASNRQLKDSYIVQFFPSENIRPSADRTPVIDDAVHVAFERYLDSSIAGLYTVRHRMTDPRLFFALSLTLHEGANISTLQGFEGVMAIHPITIMDARQVLRPLVRQSNEAVVTPMSKNNTASVLAAVAEAPHRMTGMDRLHAELGGNGIGQLIGIIDLGVDYSLTALNGGKKNGDKCFGDGCPIAGGGALVNDQGNPGWVPDPFADCPLLIHGTHVTGIAIGNDTNQGFVGVAPKARVNLYRLASCTDPFVAVDTVLSAMQRAFHDGVHIISMSISYESGWGSRPIAALASQLVDHGVIIVAANGNDGESGAFYSQSPADAPGVIGAGSVDNDVLLGRTASYVQHGASTDFVYLSAKSIPGNGSPSFPVYVTSKTPSEVNDACQPLPDSTPDLKNFVVLIARSFSCTMDTQINSAVDKGAKRILIYNRNRLGKVYADVYADVGADLHVALIDENVGVDIVNAINAGGKISISFAAQTNVAVNNPVTGRMISYFSQTGPSFDLRITGSVSAPGGSILSTFPVPSLVEPVGDQSICDDRHSYNLSDDTQLPTLKFQMFAGSRLVTVDLVQANTTFKPTIALQCGHRETSLVSPNDGVLGNVVTLIDLPRDDLQYAVAGPNYTDFKGASKPIPNGHYRFILKALRLDQPSNVSSSYETYVSHAFHIKRP
ncbi:unnamed protein product [Tilletia controversa]|nr:unnamed protein product [Tilletia controversa]